MHTHAFQATTAGVAEWGWNWREIGAAWTPSSPPFVAARDR
jgi:hypothetical protein